MNIAAVTKSSGQNRLWSLRKINKIELKERERTEKKTNVVYDYYSNAETGTTTRHCFTLQIIDRQSKL